MRYAPICLFAALYAYATAAWQLPPWVGALYLAASAACFIAYAVDKAAARAGRRRTPERTLLLLGLAGGWPGAVLAQQWLRHKSSKPSFRSKFHATVALNAGLLAWLASPASPFR
ncbi:MAG: cold-shock protein [Massilia sp.]|jgi:uncharacterized membrane protein YsdA (DUF1294 family)|nr:cold-shock protein [Massilia sp.]